MSEHRLKVMTIAGTRPDFIKLSRVIAALDQHLEHVLVHSGQNYDFELNEVFFQQLEIRRPDHFLGCSGKKVAEALADIIARSDAVLEQERPDALLLYGDTNTSLAVIPAKRRKIPVFHMEAGNRCFDQRVPEEINRKIVDHLSDVNMALTEHARRYLLSEGLRPETTIKIGSCMPEVLAHYRARIQASTALDELGLGPRDYLLVSVHREENVDREDHLLAILEALRQAAGAFDKRVVVSTHPRTRRRLEELERTGRLPADARISFLKPFGFFEYVKLQQEAFCVLSDSGTLTEEAAVLGFPAVMLREAHERPEGMDAGVAVMAGLQPGRVLEAVRLAAATATGRPSPVPDYAELAVSTKVVKIIVSYTDYVNRVVWSR